MRPDTRSFSFAWIKGSGQKMSQQPHQKLEEAGGGGGSAKGIKSEDEQQQQSTTTTGDNNTSIEDSWGVSRGNSGSRLRRLSHSLVRLKGSNRYSNMTELEDENNWQKISEEPLSLEDEELQEEEKMEVQMEPDVVAGTSQQGAKVMLPFQPVENTEGAAVTEENSGLSLSKRLNKTVQGVKTSIGNLSQRFRKSTRRRYRMPPSTPGSSASSPATRKILGRTPTKLYSPFGIESPLSVKTKTPKRLADRPSTPRIARKSMVSSMVYSPSNNFRRDLDDARRGMQDFHILSRDITRRSVRF